MKETIKEIYCSTVNFIIDFFSVQKKRFFKRIKRCKNKIKKFWYYEELGFITIIKAIYTIVCKIYNSKLVLYIKKFFNSSADFTKNNHKKIWGEYKGYLEAIREDNNNKIVNIKEQYSKFMTPRILAKSFVVVILSVFLIYDTYAWFYSEYESKGTRVTFGTVEHEVTQYDSTGAIIGTSGDTVTVIEEDDLGNTSKNTRYISVKNIGSLDVDYSLSFTLDGTTSNAGVLYYRVLEITDEVNAATITQTNNTRLKAYAAANPTPNNLETDAVNPVSNLTTIPQFISNGQIDKDEDDDDNNIRYYRIDYGMYQNITSSLYSGASVAVHANVYTTQRGVDASLSSEGQTWLVENESQLREAVLNALSGDTIKLADNITVNGTIDFSRRVHLNTDTYDLKITGDLTYDFVEVGSLSIDTSGGGHIDIDGNLYVNTPKSKVHFLGQNQTYDIFVGDTFTVNGIQNDEEDGVLLEGVRIIKNKVGNIPVDVVVMSNTRLTVAPNVVLNYVIAAHNSTNIEILNNGTITQIQLADMNLIDSFSKYQIYIYNLNTILGVLGGSSIVLPSNSTPYTGPNTGNTLIIRGVSSNDITVSGSSNYNGSNINQGAPEDSVIPIQGEPNSYYVYFRDNNETLQGLLEAYFNELDPDTVDLEIYNIKKLVIYTMNSAYFENEDFAYVESDAMPNIEYLGLANATVADGNVVNKIGNNTIRNKTSLKTVILSKTLTSIGSNAFENVNLGKIPSTGTFSFLSIPSSVSSIGSGSFSSTRYVNFEGQVPPTVAVGAFNDSANGSKFFVPIAAIDLYRNTDNINEAYVYYAGELSDNKQYFLYDYNEGYGISYFINSVSIGNSLTIPNSGTLSLVGKYITALGVNSFRGLIADSTGAAITIPNTVTLIDSYAFYDDNIVSINLGNVVTIKSHAFYNTNITTLTADNLTTIGDYAFYSTPITYLSLENVNTIAHHAFMNSTSLYEANLGKVKLIGDYAFNNCPQLGRVWFKNTNTVLVNNGESIDLTVGENSVFTNWGMYLDGRLRIYVPNGQSSSGMDYLSGYKALFSANSQFIYPTGTIIGSYRHVAIPYDWGEYSIKSVTKDNAQGESVTAYEIIEYHGADLTSSYQLPDVITLGEEMTSSITGSFWQNGSVQTFNGTLNITNNSDSTINDWTVRLNMPTGITGFSTYTNTNETLNGNIMTLTNKSYNGTIAPGGSASVSFTYSSPSTSVTVSTMNVYSSSTPLMNIISIGEYAYRHTVSTSGSAINLTANTLLNIDNHGLENISVTSLYSTSLVRIGDYGLFNTALQRVELPNLNYLGAYAMSGMETLYSADIGNVKILRNHAISDNPNLEQLFIRTTDIVNMVVDSTALTNIGTNVNNRMRIYVPDTGTCLTFYNELLTSYSEYIFPLGDIVGSYINSPIPYDIGEYAVRTITLENRAGTNISGYEIIEYHGADLTSSYQLPETLTVNGITKDVISIGDFAYKHTVSANDASISIINNKLLSIGTSAFHNLHGISSFESTSLQYLNESAFDSSSLNSFITPNLYYIGSYALANMGELYKVNLGIVAQMESNALYSLDNLVQVFFTPHQDTMVVNQNSINNVGSLTSNRIRFYVEKAEYQQEHQQTSPRTLTPSIRTVSSRSTGTGVNRRYYYEFEVTLTNPNADDVASWETSISLSNNGSFTGATNAEYYTSNRNVIFSNTSTNGTIEAGGNVKFSFTAQTTNRYEYSPTFNSNTTKGVHIDISYTQTLIDVVDTYANMFRTDYRDYFYIKGDIIGNYSSSSIPFDIGQYSVMLNSYEDLNNQTHYGLEIVEYHGPDINNAFVIPTSLEVNGTAYSVIGIGERAFRWATMNGVNTFDIVNNTLLYFEDYAFYNLQGVKVLNTPNVDSIGDYAFFNNKLYTATTENLIHLGSYAYANNSTLNYVNAGTVTSLGEGAFYGCTGMEQMFFKTRDVDSAASVMLISVGANAFYNVGTTIGNRFRIYVPDDFIGNGNVTYQVAYKNTFPANVKNYIYPTGYIVGSYTYGTLPYDIGEFSVKEKTLNNVAGNQVTGWEIIEYHGGDATSTFSIPNSVTAGENTYNIVSVGSYAYYGVQISSGTTWEVTLPNGIVEVGDYAFYQTAVSRLEGNQLTRIGKYAFADCENLTNVIFNSVITVDSYAFYSCGSLTYIQLGYGTTRINEYALWNPYRNGPNTTLSMQVTAVPTTATTALPEYDELSIFGWVYGYDSNFTYSVPSSMQSQFSSATPWKYHTYEESNYSSDFLYILDSNNKIQITAYTGNDYDVTIPDTLQVGNVSYNVSSMAANAFDNNTTVTNLTLPRYFDTLTDGFLNGNKYIRNIYVAANNTSFSSSNGILYDISGTILMRYPNGKTAQSYTVGGSVNTIAYKAFGNQDNLTSITIQSGVRNIGAYAFIDCSYLTTYTFEGDVPVLTAYKTFNKTSGLYIYVPSTYISNYRNNVYFKEYYDSIR